MALELYPTGTQVVFFSKGHPRDRCVCKVVESACVEKGKNKYYKYTLDHDGTPFKTEDGENGVRVEKVTATPGTVLYKSPSKVMIITKNSGPAFTLSPSTFTDDELDALVQDKPINVIHTEFLPRFVTFEAL
jgi:hypothetical protein